MTRLPHLAAGDALKADCFFHTAADLARYRRALRPLARDG
jgi:hypothetical protein